jgi:AI-2E family transporter
MSSWHPRRCAARRSLPIPTLPGAAQVVSGFLLMLVLLLYLVSGGEGVWRWVIERSSPHNREHVSEAAWNAASGYIRGIALVAPIDSTVITLGMLVIGTPHVGTLALLSFVSLFIPILGAWVSGVVIVLVTLAAVGTGGAVAMAVVILVAQQLDRMFVTPLVYLADGEPAPDRDADGGHRRQRAARHHLRVPRRPDGRRRLGRGEGARGPARGAGLRMSV